MPTPPDDFDALRRATPARLGVGRAGPRYPTAAMLAFRADHARAVDAVMTQVPLDWPRRNGLIEIHSEARTREEYLRHPERGRRIAPADIPRVKELRLKAGRGKVPAKPSVILLVGDGLSSAAVVKNAGPLLKRLAKLLAPHYRLAKPVFIRYARVRIEDHVGEILRPDIVCMIIGERPGLLTAESLSGYVIYRPTLKSLEPERTVISNIHAGGIPIAEAARKIAALIDDAIRHRATGAALAAATAPDPE
ncbi:MAG: ethanolamine ammonia-lyase subunit EutC [Candidatus Binataceae bacterium]